MRAADWKRLHAVERQQEGTETRQEAKARRRRIQARKFAARGFVSEFAAIQQRELGQSMSERDRAILFGLFGDEAL